MLSVGTSCPCFFLAITAKVTHSTVASLSIYCYMKKEDKILFDREYIMCYTLFVANTGEVLLSSTKKLFSLDKEFFIDFGKLLVKNLHIQDTISLTLQFTPVVQEPVIPFDSF